MPEQRDELPFSERLARLATSVAHAAHVAASLKIIASPHSHAARSEGGGWLQRFKKGTEDQVVVRPGNLNAPAETPPEVTRWVEGLKSLHQALSEASTDTLPDKKLLLRQLERQVDALADEAESATERPMRLIGDASNWATQKANLNRSTVEYYETRLRARLDVATSELVPERSVHGIFTGIVGNKILGDTVDDTLVRTGDALQAATQAGRLAPVEPERLAEIEASAQTGEAAAEPARKLAPGPMTPAELEELDVAAPRGALKRFDPALLEPKAPEVPSSPAAPTDYAVEVVDVASQVADDRDTLLLADGPVDDPAGSSEPGEPADVVEPAEPAKQAEPMKPAERTKPARVPDEPESRRRDEPGGKL